MASGNELTEQLRELRSSLGAIPEVKEPPKPILRILGSMRAEQKWNSLLAYFLNPSNPHGFDADILKAFLDKANEMTTTEIDYYHRDLEQLSVDTELQSPEDNRPDILIRSPGEWFVCLECKVESSEGDRQTQRYIEDSHIASESKSEYPEDGRHFLFLSKKHSADSEANEFQDLYWRHVVEGFQTLLNTSHGKYPDRSVSQLEDFLSTIITVTNMQEDDFERTQKEKVRLLSEYRAEIDELLQAANLLRERALEEWPERFQREVDDDLWTETWNARDTKWGTIHPDGWYLDDDLNPTDNVDETRGGDGLRLHFMHFLQDEESFGQGKLRYELVCNTGSQVRDEFHRLYQTPRWRNELEEILGEKNITYRGNKSEYTHKTYQVDQSGLPESYFETLAVAFEEHLPVAEIVDEILREAVAEVKET